MVRGDLARLGRALHQLCASGALVLALVMGALAAAEDSRFAVSPDGATVDFDVRDVARREVMRRLFAGSGVVLDWRSASFADELISGTFQGPPSVVVGQLLKNADFIVVYDRSEDRAEMSRLIIVGPATGEDVSARLSAIDAVVRPSAAGNVGPPVLASPGDAVAPQPVLPADATAPRLVPLPGDPTTYPLFSVVPVAPPALVPPSPTDTLPLVP